ncbi:MAG: DUF1573 domain-containing protein [Planctomycetota bacterium]|nr:DUF1573 domain-containing protein [Planctomycetota bacterium]
MIGEVSTTCGCSVASIEPKTVAPEGTAVVRVVGQPPAVGEKSVTVTLKTNWESHPTLELRLTMAGAKKNPIVAHLPDAVPFGSVRKPGLVESCFIETFEDANTPFWITAVPESSLDFVEVGGDLKPVETPMGGGTVLRHYNFAATLKRVPNAGGFRGEVVFRGRGGDEPIARIPVHGSGRPAVYAAPETLFASLDHGDASPTFRLTIAAYNEDFQLEAEPCGAETSPFVITKADSGMIKSRVAFDVSLKQRPAAEVSESLRFKTNLTGKQVVEVPVLITCNNK